MLLDQLEKNDVNCAITVTDAMIVGNSNGRKVKLAGTYVSSPLTWALVGRPNSSSITTSPVLRYGISRKGSGSHTMAYYSSMLDKVKDKSSLSFHVANNFSGLRQGLLNNDFDGFLWEIFTTKPFIDKGELGLIKLVPTPWSAFSFVINSDATKETSSILYNSVFPALNEAINMFQDPKNEKEMINRICKEHGHKELDAIQWLSRCIYGNSNEFSIDHNHTLESIKILKETGIVDEKYNITQLFHNDAKLYDSK